MRFIRAEYYRGIAIETSAIRIRVNYDKNPTMERASTKK